MHVDLNLLRNVPTVSVFWGTLGEKRVNSAGFQWCSHPSGLFEVLDWDHMVRSQMWYIYSAVCMCWKSICVRASVYKYVQRYLKWYQYIYIKLDPSIFPRTNASFWHIMLRYLCCDMVLAFMSLLLIVFCIQSAFQLNWKEVFSSWYHIA